MKNNKEESLVFWDFLIKLHGTTVRDLHNDKLKIHRSEQDREVYHTGEADWVLMEVSGLLSKVGI